MTAYFEYLRQIILRVFSDIGTWFTKTFAVPWSDVPNNFSDYHSYLVVSSQEFGFWGWFFWVLFLLTAQEEHQSLHHPMMWRMDGVRG